MDKSKIWKMIIILAAITVIAGSLVRVKSRQSMSLADYASQQAQKNSEVTDPGAAGTASPEHPSPAPSGAASPSPAAASPEDSLSTAPEGDSPSSVPEMGSSSSAPFAEGSAPTEPEASLSTLTGATLNGSSQLAQRTLLEEGFYYEPISDSLRRYMTGISYPAPESEEDKQELAVTFDDLRYLHLLHYDFEGNIAEGELICNAYIAQDLVEIFYELYRSEYQLEKVLLIDEYDGDDTASMEDNNTSCFNYRTVPGKTNLSKHSLGLAIDINPLYNPYITYEKDGTENISPASAAPYADRSVRFAYKIDEDDLCYKLFTEHGFTWGGHWNSSKDYQHFQKVPS